MKVQTEKLGLPTEKETEEQTGKPVSYLRAAKFVVSVLGFLFSLCLVPKEYWFVSSAAFLSVFLWLCLRSPFPNYPYYKREFDVSGKRKPDMDDYVDEFLIEDRFCEIEQHMGRIENWKDSCKKRIERSLFKRRRIRQYQAVCDDRAFRFFFVRSQTRYRQVNYVKHRYEVMTADEEWGYSYEDLLKRYQKLQEIHFETTIRKYQMKDQRKLMTPELKMKITRRDNYTCRICGKYMPDRVGLHIDHIVPISKGGKSAESNLQVLCDKCNLRKSNK